MDLPVGRLSGFNFEVLLCLQLGLKSSEEETELESWEEFFTARSDSLIPCLGWLQELRLTTPPPSLSLLG